MLEKVKNEVAKDRQRSQNTFWAEVRQRVNRATEKLQARIQAGWNQRLPGLCQHELLLWCGIRHCETLSNQHYQQPAELGLLQKKSLA